MSQTVGRWSGAVATALCVLVAVVLTSRSGAVAATAVVGGLAGLAPYVARPRDRTAVLAGLLVTAAAVIVLCTGAPSSSGNIGWFGGCILIVLASSELGSRGLVVATGLYQLAIGSQALLAPDPGWLAWFGGGVLTLVACWAIEREQRLVSELREAQAGLAARSRAEERTRVAREMHDVMGHALTVSLLHITAARLAVDEDPAAASASLAEAERLSRSSLEEVRAAVGVLRDGAQPDAPLPGADDLPALVASVERSGLDVTLTTSGDLAGLSEVAGLAVYRIVQEALTNVVRHAPAARTSVAVAVGDAVTVQVDSAAPGRTDARPGNGVAGMTERATALGGTLSAGPGGPGWRVAATWPARQPGPPGRSTGAAAGASA